MSKTLTPEKEAQLKADQKAYAKDLKRAEELMKAFADLSAEKVQIESERDAKIAPIKTEYDDKLSPILASLAESETELKAIGERNKSRFTKNKLALEHGYLLLSIKTVIKTGKEFVMSKFVAKFPQLITNSFNLAEMKKVFTDGDARANVMKMDVDLKNEETIQVKVTKEL